MTSSLTIRPLALPAFVLAAVLVLAPNGSRAEGPGAAAFASPSHETNDGAGRYAPEAPGLALATTGSGPSARHDEAATGEVAAVETAVVENAWDFTKPDSIPGFASTPYPVLSNPEIAD